MTDPLKLAFTWRDGLANMLPLPYKADGKFSTYDGSGFVYDLTNLTTGNLVDAFTYLQDNIWLDRQTRCLFLSLVTYNANYNLYAVMNFRIELSLAGTISPQCRSQGSTCHCAVMGPRRVRCREKAPAEHASSSCVR